MNYLTFKTCSKGSHNLIQKENMKKNLLLTSIALMSIASAMAEGASTPNKYFTHSAAILQQKATASGKVLDTNGEPLIGVTIMEEGTQNGTVTGLDGSFSLNMTKSNAMLKFSYIGFTDVKLPAANNLTVTMKEEQNALNEVVVVGYGTQKKVNLTGSVVSVDLAKETNSRPVTTAAQALQGMAAGLDIIQGSGKPGEFHLPSLVTAILATELCHRSVAIAGHVLYPFCQLLDSTRTDIATDVWLTANHLAEIQELVCTEGVVFDGATPVVVLHLRTLLARTDAVHPVIFVSEASSRPS